MSLRIDQIYLSRDLRKKENREIQDDSTDVIVKMEGGDIYVASFFSYDGIAALRNRNQITGHFLRGKYFWSNGMILIDVCDKRNIMYVIDDLMEEGDFKEVFRKL